MTAADKRRRAKEYAAELKTWRNSIGVDNFIDKVADAMLAYGSELEAAAIERCEKELRDKVIDFLSSHLPPAYWKESLIERVFSLMQDPIKVALASRDADAIAKLKEGK